MNHDQFGEPSHLIVGQLGPGSYFGQEALLSAKVKSDEIKVFCSSDCHYLLLQREHL